MIARVPSAAPMAPPLTGASTHAHAVTAGDVGQLAAASSGATVEWTATTSAGVAAAARATSPSTSRTWSSSRTITQTQVDPVGQLGDARRPPSAPAASSSATGSGATSYTRRSAPAARRAAAPSACRCCRARRTRPAHRGHDRNTCPPSTARIWPVTHDGLVGEQEQAGADHVLGLAHPLEREALHQLLRRVAGLRAGGLGVGRPGRDRVDPDVHAAELVGELLGEPVDADLGQAVEAGVEPGRRRALVDDRAAAAGLHVARSTARVITRAPSMFTDMNLR